MLRPRVIPCLLIHQRGLVKTVRFGDPKYVGDPINSVRIFNEKSVDELFVLDIDATVRGAEPDLAVIRHLAAESRMPLCYGGGVSNVEQAVEIIRAGVEKVALSASIFQRPHLVTDLARVLGSQSVVAVIDAKWNDSSGTYEAWTHNATVNSGRDVLECAVQLAKDGAGEIVINSVDRDGTRSGYDIPFAKRVRQSVSVPLTILGGADSLQDIEALIAECGYVGAAAGSLFVFKGIYQAVLINYPNEVAKRELTARALARWQGGRFHVPSS